MLVLGGVLTGSPFTVAGDYIPQGEGCPPGTISESVANGFASRVSARETFTPPWSKPRTPEALTRHHPSSCGVKVKAERKVALVKEAKRSSQVMMLGATVTRPAALVVTVMLRETCMIWVGGHESRRSPGSRQ